MTQLNSKEFEQKREGLLLALRDKKAAEIPEQRPAKKLGEGEPEVVVSLYDPIDTTTCGS